MIQNKLKSLTIITLLLLGYSPYIINGGVSATTINMSTSMNEPNIKEEDEEEEDTETNAEDNVIDSDDEEIIINSKDGKEEIFEVPEGMIIDVEKMMSDFNNKQYLTVDTACDMRDINPVFEQEVYIDRLKRMPTAMEMPWNEVVQRFIDRYSGRLRKSVSFMLEIGRAHV